MEMQAHIGYHQVLEMVYQLPQEEVSKLLKKLQSDVAHSKNQVGTQKYKLTKMQKLLLQAPTWSDEEYKSYLEANEHFNAWRG
ncbi:hypothetical protein FACS189440_02230 [Bacteroidia bacterium]|jgi:hypothetical protein|nr:hypothetical protein FACS189423_02080 [Bacteroidia bacterium]GHT45708.1 hypothetical protein FACS189440_02230 [Bacteroidia bacterium]